MKLIIGNKNYSSWSLRPWLLLKHAGIAFEEQLLSFAALDFKQQVLRHSPVGKVPVLVDGDLAVWDSLAIAEYLAEKFPEKKLWPAAAPARARARSICAEMHSSFQALRNNYSMNIHADLAGMGWNLAVQKDIDRISAMWLELREQHAARGPFLFGEFSIADAFYAPVVTRFNTYKPKLDNGVIAYMQTVLALPAMQQWIADAARENEFLEDHEDYRAKR